MELRRLTTDVYACLQEDRGLGFSNSGLVNRGGGLVVDTFWDLPHTREMIRHYAEVWSGPARRVVNTHHNGDHCWGNQLFPQAEILGHRLCAEAMAKETPAAMQALRNAGGSGDPAVAALARQLAAEWDFAGVELRPPTTLVDERAALDLDGMPAELLYVGPAHTQGDLVVWLPEPRILFTGDILFRLCTPIGWEGTFAKWIEALERLEGLAPDVVVPGHGPLCGIEGLREQRAYLAYVRDEARHLLDAGLPLEEAARRIDLGPYADWTEPERIVFSLERARRELRGEPWNAPLDPVALFRAMHALRADPRFPRR
jgi:cyclase